MFRTFQHPETGRVKEVKVGFSWTVLFWGIIPMLCRGDWTSALASYLTALMMLFVLPIEIGYPLVLVFYLVIAAYYNNYYANKLIQKGYKQLN